MLDSNDMCFLFSITDFQSTQIIIQSPTEFAMIKLIILLFYFKFCSAIESGAGEYNCSIIPKESINFTCCDMPVYYSDDIQDQANKRSREYFKANQNISKSVEQRDKLLDFCLFHKFLMESAGFVIDDKFQLDKFNGFIKNNAELVDAFSIYADDEFVKFFEKCIKLANEIDVKGKQEELMGIKKEYCDVTYKFVWKCYVSHTVAVSLEILKMTSKF